MFAYSANDLVKRVLSLKFQPSAAIKQAKITAMTQKVKRHAYDTNSVEVKSTHCSFIALLRKIFFVMHLV